MNFTEFTKLALKTESILEPLTKEIVEKTGLTNRALHGIIGMYTEDTEIELAQNLQDRINLLEELGDKLWYVAILADEFRITYLLEEAQSVSIDIEENDILDLAKKSLFYGSKFNIELAKEIVYSIYIDIINVILDTDGDVSSVMETNIKKLQQRYPDKFTSRDATERDLEKERAILEDNLS